MPQPHGGKSLAKHDRMAEHRKASVVGTRERRAGHDAEKGLVHIHLSSVLSGLHEMHQNGFQLGTSCSGLHFYQVPLAALGRTDYRQTGAQPKTNKKAIGVAMRCAYMDRKTGCRDTVKGKPLLHIGALAQATPVWLEF